MLIPIIPYPDMDGETAIELEALACTYGEALETCTNPDDGLELVRVSLAPRDASWDEQFVAATLEIRVPPGYPTCAPEPQLTDCRGAHLRHRTSGAAPAQPPTAARPRASSPSALAGLGDARRCSLNAALRSEALSLRGELQLGHMVETATDLLAAANCPEGDCCFCLAPLAEAAAAGESGEVLRLRCFHCYHS